MDYRPGANGTIGADHVAKSAPDGYTLLAGSSLVSRQRQRIEESALRSCPRFCGCGLSGDQPYRIRGEPDGAGALDQGAHRDREVVAAVVCILRHRRLPDLAGELLALAAEVKMLHVPYKAHCPR